MVNSATATSSKLAWVCRALGVFVLLLGAGAAIVFISQHIGRQRLQGSLASSPIGDIGRAWISSIASRTDGSLTPPEALTDVYALAAHLARTGVLGEARPWFVERSDLDPALGPDYSFPQQILLPDEPRKQARINPAFQNAPLAFAVALLPDNIEKLPPETPILWTRGLQPDGTWAKDSPFGGQGGEIFFAGGNVKYFKTINDRLVGWNRHVTSNILEALPPGTRVSEYHPTPEDLARVQALVERERTRQQLGFAAQVTCLLLLTLACSFGVTCPRGWRELIELRVVALIVGVASAAGFWASLPKS